MPSWPHKPPAVSFLESQGGYFRLREKGRIDAAKLLLTFAVTTGFLALDMYIFQPRYSGIFPQLLHPRLP